QRELQEVADGVAAADERDDANVVPERAVHGASDLGRRLQRIQVRQRLAREAIERLARMALRAVTEDRAHHQVGTRTDADLPLELLAHARGGGGCCNGRRTMGTLRYVYRGTRCSRTSFVSPARTTSSASR